MGRLRLKRKPGQRFVLDTPAGARIVVTVEFLKEGSVGLSIEAPEDHPIWRPDDAQVTSTDGRRNRSPRSLNRGYRG